MESTTSINPALVALEVFVGTWDETARLALGSRSQNRIALGVLSGRRSIGHGRRSRGQASGAASQQLDTGSG